MFHAKAIDGCRVVVSDFLLFGIESDSLPDERLVGFAVRAPDRERHFEAHDQGAGYAEVAGSCA